MAHAGVKGPHWEQEEELVIIPAGTTHQSPFHLARQLGGGKGVGKALSARIQGDICRRDEKCVKPLADRFPASIPLVPHCSPSSQHSWSWLRPSPPPPSRTWLWSTYLMLPLLQTWLRSPPPLIPTFPTGRQRSVCLNLLRRLVLFHSWAGFWDVLLRSSCRRLGPLSGSSFSWNSSGHTWPYLTENTHWSKLDKNEFWNQAGPS